MAHGYGRGCRCAECREKHRETQMKYRHTVQRKRVLSKVKHLEQIIVGHGLDEDSARELAKKILTEIQ